MIDELELKQAFLRATDPGDAHADLGEALGRGRSARRRRRRVVAASAAVGAAAVVTAVSMVVPRALPDRTSVDRGPANATSAGESPLTDFVPGATTDETLQEAVRTHLPSLGAPRDVFPSDNRHNGPMPDADFASATDWQAEYDVAGGGFLRLFVGHPAGTGAYGCPDCVWSLVPDGRTSTQVSQRLDTDGSTARWRFLVVFEADSGFVVSVLEEADGASEDAAARARAFSDAALLDLARDDRLTFPAPTA